MDSFIDEMRNPGGNIFRKQCKHDPRWPSYDEEMLYYMTSQAFDLRPLRGYRRRGDGLHVGTFRIIEASDSFAINTAHETDGRNSLEDWRDEPKIDAIIKSGLFRKSKLTPFALLCCVNSKGNCLKSLQYL